MSTKDVPIAVRYIGPAPCPVRQGERRFAPGEIITGSLDLMAELAARADFQAVTEEHPGAVTDSPSPVADGAEDAASDRGEE